MPNIRRLFRKNAHTEEGDVDTKKERQSILTRIRELSHFGPTHLGADEVLPSSPTRDIRFLLDHTLAPFQEIITQTGYQVTLVDPPKSQLEILEQARSTGRMLLTAEQSYLGIANKQNNKFGILILPASFSQSPQHDHHYEYLGELLNHYSRDIRKAKLYPIGVVVANMAGMRWTVVKKR